MGGDTARGLWFMMMEGSMRDSGNAMLKWVKDGRNSVMSPYTLEITSMANPKESASTSGQTANPMTENGIMV